MHRAKKSLGQNFLVDPNLQLKIVDGAGLTPEDTVLEIGPGQGALTRIIAGRVRKLVAVELDDQLAATLETEFADTENVQIINADILDIDFDEIAADAHTLKIIGNIPYNITTPLIFHLLERERRPADIVLMVQREVADRIVAPPGDKAYGALSIGVRAFASAEPLFHVSRGAFRPAPNVDSTVLRITPFQPPPLDDQEEEDLRALTRVAFGWRRKQLQKILRSSPDYGLDVNEVERVAREAAIDPTVRPEDLAPEDFIRLARTLRAHGRPLPETATDAAASEPSDEDRLRFLGIVAHEMRSPLTAIMGYQELLLEGIYGPLDERARDALQRIGRAARQLLTLTDGMEELVGLRGSTSDDFVNPESDFLAESIAEFIRDAQSRNIALHIDIPPVLQPLACDPDRARGTVELVLHAALKLIAPSELRFSVRQDDGFTTLALEGPGLEKWKLDGELDAARLTSLIDSGAALRLAIATRAARGLGGDLTSTPTPTGGRLELRLPTAAGVRQPEA